MKEEDDDERDTVKELIAIFTVLYFIGLFFLSIWFLVELIKIDLSTNDYAYFPVSIIDVIFILG